MLDALVAVRERLKLLWSESTSGDLESRIRSSLVLAPVALFAVIMGGMWFNVLVLVGAILMSFEWQSITRNLEGDRPHKRRWRWRGVAYIAIVASSFLWLRNLDLAIDGYAGVWIVLWMMTVVWATDIAAYFTGRNLGGPKLAPSISPNKTWSGLIGGVTAAALIGMVFGIITGMPSIGTLFWMSAVTAIVSQGGDLLESHIKRLCGVKDSGDLIPGHGGILDRVDGFVTAAPFVMLLFVLMGKP